ncbi:MAG: FRG domain-containing protein [Bacilli bacterium]
MTNITCISDLIKEIEIEIENQSLKCNFEISEKLLFRGQSNIHFEILPSIARKPNSAIGNSLVWFESELINSAKISFPDMFPKDIDPINLLAKLQHYGIPTRLLDITENPLVGLYFACNLDPDKDGELIAFIDKDEKPTDCGIINAIADTCNIFEGDFDVFFKSALTKKYFADEKARIINKQRANPKYLTEMLYSMFDKREASFIYVANMTQRQLLQSGKFLLFHNEFHQEGKKCYFTDEIKSIAKNSNIIYKRYTIPSANKKAILKQLDYMGINEKWLFSDSPDIVLNNITKRYKERFSIF